MNIFIQSTSIEEIDGAVATGLADGIAISVADLADNGVDGEIKEQIAGLAGRFAIPLCVAVPAIAGPELYRDGRELARLSDQVIVQLPFIEDAIVPMRKLVADGVRVCASHVFGGAQAFLAAKIGAEMVLVEVDDLDAHGQHGAEIVTEIRHVIDKSDLECDLVIGGLRRSTDFTACLLAGTDIVCATPGLLQTLVVHALTDRGVDRFMRTLSRRHRPRGV